MTGWGGLWGSFVVEELQEDAAAEISCIGLVCPVAQLTQFEADPVNIGHDHEVTIKELVRLILQVTGRKPKVIYDTSMPEGYPRCAAHTSKLGAVTGGWQPANAPPEGVAEMIEWYERTYGSSSRRVAP